MELVGIIGNIMIATASATAPHATAGIGATGFTPPCHLERQTGGGNFIVSAWVLGYKEICNDCECDNENGGYPIFVGANDSDTGNHLAITGGARGTNLSNGSYQIEAGLHDGQNFAGTGSESYYGIAHVQDHITLHAVSATPTTYKIRASIEVSGEWTVTSGKIAQGATWYIAVDPSLSEVTPCYSPIYAAGTSNGGSLNSLFDANSGPESYSDYGFATFGPFSTNDTVRLGIDFTVEVSPVSTGSGAAGYLSNGDFVYKITLEPIDPN